MILLNFLFLIIIKNAEKEKKGRVRVSLTSETGQEDRIASPDKSRQKQTQLRNRRMYDEVEQYVRFQWSIKLKRKGKGPDFILGSNHVPMTPTAARAASTGAMASPCGVLVCWEPEGWCDFSVFGGVNVCMRCGWQRTYGRRRCEWLSEVRVSHVFGLVSILTTRLSPCEEIFIPNLKLTDHRLIFLMDERFGISI